MIRYLFLFMISLFTIRAEYTYVSDLNVTQYLGKWIEVYGDLFDNTFQKNGRCLTAEYQLIDDNTISVFNSEIDNKNNLQTISGVAYYESGNSGGQLTVKLEGTPKAAPYWVIELGPVVNGQYDYSIVSDDKQISLFVLTRNETTFFNEYNELVLKHLNNFGFDKVFNKPELINQTNCNLLK